MEAMIEIVRRTSRNVKFWQNGDMCLIWTVRGMPKAEQRFRKITGLAKLAAQSSETSPPALHPSKPRPDEDSATLAR